MKYSKKILILTILVAFVVTSCGITEVNPPKHKTEIKFEVLADGVGNKDGKVSPSERDTILNFFKREKEAWIIGAIKLEYRDTTVFIVKAEDVVEMFGMARNLGPFASQAELVNSVREIKIPWLGIYVVKKDGQIYYVDKFFRAFGGSVINNIVELKIE